MPPPSARSSARAHSAWQDRDRRLAHRAGGARQSSGPIPFQGQQPAAYRSDGGDWSDRLPAAAAQLGLRQITERDHALGLIAEGGIMPYTMKPLACEPSRIKGMSEKLLVSHYENNYGGAVNRLNAITAQLVELDFVKAPGFLINGLKREELIAMNSMILHEVFFRSLGDESTPEGELHDALTRDFGSFD